MLCSTVVSNVPSFLDDLQEYWSGNAMPKVTAPAACSNFTQSVDETSAASPTGESLRALVTRVPEPTQKPTHEEEPGSKRTGRKATQCPSRRGAQRFAEAAAAAATRRMTSNWRGRKSRSRSRMPAWQRNKMRSAPDRSSSSSSSSSCSSPLPRDASPKVKGVVCVNAGRCASRRSRKSMWDVEQAPPNADAILIQATLACGKKRRECYVGNLAAGQVTSEMLKIFLNRLFKSLPSYVAVYGELDAVTLINNPSCSGGCFAFVEFIDELVASTAVEMSGVELAGRPLRIGRPQSSNPTSQTKTTIDPAPLDVSQLRENGMLPPAAISVVSPTAVVINRNRELYFGNLRASSVTEEVLNELLNPVCVALPEYVADAGPAIPKITLASVGTYAFVQFQNPEMTTQVLEIFDEIELLGRRLRVNRPLSRSQENTSEAFRAGAAAVTGLSIL